MTARENPFATARLERIRYRAEGARVEELVARFHAMGRRASIAGPEGSGKTTLLGEMSAALGGEGFKVIWLRAGRGVPARFSADAGEIVVLDESDRMGTLRWRSFLWQARRAAGLLISTHRGGRLPALWRCTTSAALLEEIISELLGGKPCGRGLAEELFERHGGNIRSALLEMYDRCADRAEL